MLRFINFKIFKDHKITAIIGVCRSIIKLKFGLNSRKNKEK